jgi:hypothetical protein
MGDKSRPHHAAKKQGKTLKEKRAAKHAKAEAAKTKTHVEIIPHDKG